MPDLSNFFPLDSPDRKQWPHDSCRSARKLGFFLRPGIVRPYRLDLQASVGWVT